MKSSLSALSIAQLRMLGTILELRNLSHAAGKLGSTQSLLSRHLATFREVFGDQLLVRQGRDYILTERALALVDSLKVVMKEVEKLDAPSSFDPITCERRFTIAATDYVARYQLPKIISELAVIAPKVSLDYVSWEHNRYDWLASGKVDLAATMINDAPPEYHGRMFGEDSPVCCMRVGHPLANFDSIDQHNYLQWPHVKISGGGDKDSFVETFLSKNGQSRSIVLNVPFYFAAMGVVEATDAIVTVPWHIVNNYLKKDSFCWRPIDFIDHRFKYWVVWHSRTHNSLEQQWFRGFIYKHSVSLFAGDGVGEFS